MDLTKPRRGRIHFQIGAQSLYVPQRFFPKGSPTFMGMRAIIDQFDELSLGANGAELVYGSIKETRGSSVQLKYMATVPDVDFGLLHEEPSIWLHKKHIVCHLAKEPEEGGLLVIKPDGLNLLRHHYAKHVHLHSYNLVDEPSPESVTWTFFDIPLTVQDLVKDSLYREQERPAC